MIVSRSLNELKQNAVDDFNLVLNYFKEYNIKYWLDYGTLLGCIRNKESILWDGEFDISLWNDQLEKIDNYLPGIGFPNSFNS